MRLDQKVERPQGGGTRADLVGERGQAELDAFVRIAIALTVQRLVLAELLEQDHRKQARAEHAARGRVERRGRLTYRFAGAAGEALAHGLDDLPPARDHRSEEHTSELQSLMRISYAGFCLKKKNT